MADSKTLFDSTEARAASAAALTAGDLAAATAASHYGLALDALQILAESGHWLGARGTGMQNGQYISEAARAHRAFLKVTAERGDTPTAKVQLAADLLYLIARWFELVGDPPVQGREAHAANIFVEHGALCGAIGHTSALLWGERRDVFAKAEEFDRQREARKRGQAIAAHRAWFEPGQTICREAYTLNPSMSDRDLARTLEKRRSELPGLPDREQIIRQIAKWRKDPVIVGFGPRPKL